MSRELSVASILKELQTRMEHHRSREAFHAQQEAFHQQERAHHAAELQTIRERFEAFQAAADAAGEVVSRPREAKTADDSIPSGRGAVLSKLVARVVAGKGPLERIGAKEVTREIQARYGDRLGRKIDPRTVAVLRGLFNLADPDQRRKEVGQRLQQAPEGSRRPEAG